MSIIEKDPDLFLNESIPCATGVSRGYREVVDFCIENPDLYIDIKSLGTFKHYSGDDYSITSERGFTVSASDLISLVAEQRVTIHGKTVVLNGTHASKVYNPILVLSDGREIDSNLLSRIFGLADTDALISSIQSSVVSMQSDILSIYGRLDDLDSDG